MRYIDGNPIAWRIGVVVGGLMLIGSGACSKSANPQPADKAPAVKESHGLLGEVSKADQDSGRSQQPYVKNMRLVGQQDIRNRGNNGNLGYLDDCAYVAAYYGGNDPLTGLAVIDVSNAKNPELLKILPGAPGSRSAQVEAHEGRRLLAVMPYSSETPYGDPKGPTVLNFYDAKDCKNPVLVGTFDFGEVVTHEFKFSPDGKTVYATVNNFAGADAPPTPGDAMQVVDVSDPSKPAKLTTWDLSQEPGMPRSGMHDMDINDEGTRAYASVRWIQDGIQHKGMSILDISEVTARRPNPKIRRISSFNWGPPESHGLTHTTILMQIKGKPFTLCADETGGSGGTADPARGWGRIIDVSNERYPLQISSIRLPVSNAENAEMLKGDNADYATHFVAVDDRHEAHLAFISWYSAGMRVWDISDPYAPTEIAYYIPGARPNPVLKPGSRYPNTKVDYVYSYPRYRPETGQIWVSSVFNGLMILELENNPLRPAQAPVH